MRMKLDGEHLRLILDIVLVCLSLFVGYELTRLRLHIGLSDNTANREENARRDSRGNIYTNVLWIRNLCTLLHRRQADAAWSPTRWQHFSAGNDVMAVSLKV